MTRSAFSPALRLVSVFLAVASLGGCTKATAGGESHRKPPTTAASDTSARPHPAAGVNEARANAATGPTIAASDTATPSPGAPTSVKRIKAEGQLGPGTGTVVVDLKAPRGGKLTEGAPLRLSATGEHLRFPEKVQTKLDPTKLPVRLPIVVTDGATGPAQMDLTYYWCTEGDSASCRPERAKLVVELDLSGSGEGGEVHFTHQPES